MKIAVTLSTKPEIIKTKISYRKFEYYITEEIFSEKLDIHQNTKIARFE